MKWSVATLGQSAAYRNLASPNTRLAASMNRSPITVLTIVNAPYRHQLDGAGLEMCLSDIELAKQYSGQVSSFLSEVPIELQIEFAAEYNISLGDLEAFASTFAAWSGETYHLAQ